jgi:hypothetical protein
MTDRVIQVENVGKRYRIRHGDGGHYTALRDVIANMIRRGFRPRDGGGRAADDEDFWALRCRSTSTVARSSGSLGEMAQASRRC